MPPKDAPQKFLFNNRDFGDPNREEPNVKSASAASSKPAPPPPPPTFSEADLISARQEGYDKGFQEATLASKNSHEARLAQMASEMLRQVQGHISTHNMNMSVGEHEALGMALAIVEHVFPVLNEKIGVDQFLFDAQQLLQQARGQEKVVFHVHPEMVHDLSAFLAGHDDVSLASSTDVQPGDIRMTWMHGGAEMTREDIMQKVIKLMRDALEGESKAGQVQMPAGMENGDGLA